MLLIALSEFLMRLSLDVFQVVFAYTLAPFPNDRVRAIASDAEGVAESSLTLPVELEHMVLESLRHDRRTLRICSLVCKDWKLTARKYLFRTLHASGKEELQNLSSLLSSAPDIRANIQILVLNGAGVDVDYRTSIRTLMELIADLPKLRELEVSDVPCSMDPGVVNTPHRQSLRQLKLAASCCQKDNFLSLMNIMALFSSIDKLQVEDDYDNPIQEPLPPPEQLLQEGLIPSGGFVQISALEALEIEPHWLPILYASLRANGALSSTMPGIELTLSYDVVTCSHAFAVDEESDLLTIISGYGTFLRQLGPSLRGLQLYFFYPTVFGHTYFARHWVDVLGLSACTNLEHLFLDVSSATRYFDSESAEMMSSVWAAYLELLCHGAHFSKLRRTGLCVCVGDMQNDPVFSLDWSRLEDALHRLPALQTFLIDVFFMISKYSVEPFLSRLRGLGSKLTFKTYGMAPGHGIDDCTPREIDGRGEGSAPILDDTEDEYDVEISYGL